MDKLTGVLNGDSIMGRAAPVIPVTPPSSARTLISSRPIGPDGAKTIINSATAEGATERPRYMRPVDQNPEDIQSIIDRLQKSGAPILHNHGKLIRTTPISDADKKAIIGARTDDELKAILNSIDQRNMMRVDR